MKIKKYPQESKFEEGSIAATPSQRLRRMLLPSSEVGVSWHVEYVIAVKIQ